MENLNNKVYTKLEMQHFFRSIKNHKFECFYKMCFTYRLSRFEMLDVEWENIDFINNTITIYPVSYIVGEKQNRGFWEKVKKTDSARTYPLLPHIKDLLLKEYAKQSKNKMNFGFNNHYLNFVCIRKNGKRLNANTLSRNLQYIARDNNLPRIRISGLRKTGDKLFYSEELNNDFFLCWSRYDINIKFKNIYKEYNLFKNKRHIEKLNRFIKTGYKTENANNFEM